MHTHCLMALSLAAITSIESSLETAEQNMVPPERIPKSWTTRPTRRTRPQSPYHMGRLLRSSHKLLDQHLERPRGPRNHIKSLARTSHSQIPTLAIRAHLPLTPRWNTPLPIRYRPEYCHPSHRRPPPSRRTRNMARSELNFHLHRRRRLPHT